MVLCGDCTNRLALETFTIPMSCNSALLVVLLGYLLGCKRWSTRVELISVNTPPNLVEVSRASMLCVSKTTTESGQQSQDDCCMRRSGLRL